MRSASACVQRASCLQMRAIGQDRSPTLQVLLAEGPSMRLAARTQLDGWIKITQTVLPLMKKESVLKVVRATLVQHLERKISDASPIGNIILRLALPELQVPFQM